MTKDKINIIFMGTPEFAVPALERLHKEFCVKCAVTVPDKPRGRGQVLVPSAVKQKSVELSIPVLQPESLKDDNFIKAISEFQPDIIVIIAFRILPAVVFNLAKLGTFNIHASLLPKYRGAAPINWAIINGENQTGLTSFLLDEKVDTGKILLQNSIDIPDNATAGDLHDLMMPLAAELAVETCNLIIEGNYTPLIQDNSLATPAPKLFRENCKINFAQDSENLRNFINGVSPAPGAWLDWEGKRYKVLRAEFSPEGEGEPGKYFIENNKLNVYCGNGIITFLEIQPQDKKPMKIEDFIRGYRGNSTGLIR
ncbi:MAG: methionyl-tRNA formyltransferase [Bacteroidetes bacterium]|nr:MAG: methionyl-tRNA formyltransferase [Bacteroidota bacterium]